MTRCGWVIKLFFSHEILFTSKVYHQKLCQLPSFPSQKFISQKNIRLDDHRIPLSVTFNQQPSGVRKTSFDNPTNCLISWLWKAQSGNHRQFSNFWVAVPMVQKENFKNLNTKVINFQMLRTSVLTFSRFTGTIPSLGRFAFRQASLFRFGQ